MSYAYLCTDLFPDPQCRDLDSRNDMNQWCSHNDDSVAPYNERCSFQWSTRLCLENIETVSLISTELAFIYIRL